MKIVVDIPDTKFCTKCPLLREVVDCGMEESHRECSLLDEKLDNYNDYNKKVKKSKYCPVINTSSVYIYKE
jgi:hypothetical protein